MPKSGRQARESGKPEEIIETIRSSPNPDVAQERLMSKFEFTEAQAAAILRMTLARLTGQLDRKIGRQRSTMSRCPLWMGSKVPA